MDSRGDGPGEMGDDLPPVDLGNGRTATDVASGWTSTHDASKVDAVKAKVRALA